MANVDIETTKNAGPAVENGGGDAHYSGLPVNTTRVQPWRVAQRATRPLSAVPVQTALLTALVLGRVATVPEAAAEPSPGATTALPAPTDPGPAVRPWWDRNGTYVWLGPVGAATWTAAPPDSSGSAWDSAFGADLAVVRVSQCDPIGVLGGSAGANRSTRHDGRIWLDAVIGTPIAGHMVGVSAGPILALSSDYHPRLGASIRIWGFVGIAPYARFGVVGSNAFIEMGVHVPLPVLRR